MFTQIRKLDSNADLFYLDASPLWLQDHHHSSIHLSFSYLSNHLIAKFFGRFICHFNDAFLHYHLLLFPFGLSNLW